MTLYKTEKGDTRSHEKCPGNFRTVVILLSQSLKVTIALEAIASGVRSFFGTNLRSVDGGVEPGHYIFSPWMSRRFLRVPAILMQRARPDRRMQYQDRPVHLRARTDSTREED
jgi:hypothetical protein